MKSPTKYDNLNIRTIIGQFDKIASPKKKPMRFIEEFSVDEESQVVAQEFKEANHAIEREPISQSTPHVQNIERSSPRKAETTSILETIASVEYPEESEVDDLDYSYKAPHREPAEEYFENFISRYPSHHDNDLNEELEKEELEGENNESDSYEDSITSHRSIFGKTIHQEESLIEDLRHDERPFFKTTIYIDVFTGYIGLALLVLMIILRFLYMWQQREEVSFLRTEVKELSGVVKALELKFSKLDVTASSINIPLNFTYRS